MRRAAGIATGILALLAGSGLLAQDAPPAPATGDIVIHADRVLDGRGQGLRHAIVTVPAGRLIVRGLKAQGADLIKLFASSGLGAGGAQTLSDEQIGAICSEAKAQGLRSVVHAISAQSVRAATLAGCTQIEHGTFVTDA